MRKLSTTSVKPDDVERKETREQLRQDALAAWNHYEATALHVTASEADAWLEKLAKGENPPAPESRVANSRLFAE